MGKRVFTKEQLTAIETRDKSLLVSAAAGSGKTATLTERIIRSITDGTDPEDIGRMLIVTFTNAAVAELRERISTALKAKLAEEPDNKRIEKQLYMLPSARISTIDSFCNDLLKNNAERFGISPKYRIADPIEAKILTHSVLSGLIDAIYEGEAGELCSPTEFEELAFCLAGVKKDSALEEVFELLYEKSKSCEEGVRIYRLFSDRLFSYADIALEKNPYTEYAIARAKEAAHHFRRVSEKLYSELAPDDKYRAALDADITILAGVEAAKTYSETREALRVKFPALPAVRGEKTAAQADAQASRAEMKRVLDEQIFARYFEYTEKEWREHLAAMAKTVRILALFLEKFDALYFEEKKARGMLEYSDIERLAYLALYDGENPSELALSERKKYSSVYIDEYQDVNVLQNKIFLAISQPTNRFTVGDIKQSIYGFRSARPDIFAEMKNSYPPIDSSDGSDTASVFMSKNFRCDRGVVDFVNEIFDSAFSLCRESIGYVSQDRLEFSKIYDGGEPEYKRPEIHLFPDSADATYGGFTAREFTPLHTAAEIKRLLDEGSLNSGEKIEPKDIAIVIRKDNGRIRLYTEALLALGIPVKSSEGKNFFLNPEIQLILCLLNAINNPMRDIYLAGLMLSPLFEFTPDELYRARRMRALSLWDSVKRYSEEYPEEKKFSDFISALDRYRRVSEGMRADELILRLYNECGIFALTAKDGSRENLMLLYDYAKKFESSSFEGLYNFINYVNTVIESGASFSSKRESDAANSVTILTVHKSKGLEYPVVFLADAASDLISRNERSTRVAFSDELGVAMRLRIPGGLALVESPIYNVIIDRNCDRSREEELRVYYVALTRAREKLYIIGAPKTSSQEEFNERVRLKNIYKSPYTVRELKTFTDVLFLTASNAEVVWASQDGENEAQLSHGESLNCQIKLTDADSTRQNPAFDLQLYDSLKDRFSYKYPRPHLTLLPEKLSISSLYPSVLDGTEEEPRLFIDGEKFDNRESSMRAPDFISQSKDRRSSAEGIATHNFMQFFNVERFADSDAEEELSRLVKEGFISSENAELVRLSEIELFRKSELYGEMQRAEKLYREFRFSVMLPASLFTENEEKKKLLKDEKILLQGVMDCIILDSDGALHLVDYKTDRLKKEELENKALAQKKLAKKHSLQLSYYALAIEKIFGTLPKTTRIYSLPLGDTVSL
ncbi:MAG: hypothetical protein E7612_01990 [Ruminococcaceae bacterium]|nr:hypothetical protein [Oscillospiraceae bacterium]